MEAVTIRLLSPEQKGKTDQAIDATLSKKKEARRTSKVFK